MMNHDETMTVNHDEPWRTMTNHDSEPWQTMTNHDSEPWRTMTNHDSEPWRTMTNHDEPPQNIMNHDEPWRTTTNHHEPWQNIMNHDKLPQIIFNGLNHDMNHDMWTTTIEPRWTTTKSCLSPGVVSVTRGSRQQESSVLENFAWLPALKMAKIFLCNFGQIFHYFKQFRGIFEVGNSIFCSSLVVGGTPHLDLDRCQSRSRLAI